MVLALSLPNELFSWGNPALGLLALTPLFIGLSETTSYRQSFWAGAVFGGVAHGLSSYWLWFFQDFRLWTLGSTIIAYMVVYGFVGLYLRAAIKRTGLVRPLVFAAVWAVFEWGKSNGFLGYPWGLVAYSWNTVAPATQIAESTGVYGLSFALALFSASLGEVLVEPRHNAPGCHEGAFFGRLGYFLPARGADGHGRLLAAGHVVVAMILMLGIVMYGFVALHRERTPRGSFNAVLVQQNLDPWSGTEAENLAVSIGLARQAISGAAASADVILFSETTLRRPWNGFQRFFARTPAEDPLASLMADSGAYLLTGAPEILDYKTFEATNSVILINPHGIQEGTYAKMHPVPFAEAIPFWEYEPFRLFIQNVVGLESGWVLGTERVIFKLPTRGAGMVRLAAPICFEDAFASLCRDFVRDGAEVLINETNDSWSRTHSAEIQHFVAARFRSIELRRTLVRSTNGGVSAVVGSDGSIIESLPLFQSTSRMVSVPVYTAERSPYLDYGDWFVAVLACFLALVACILWFDDTLQGRSSHERT
jgi:apolipoprotein N-acyltransferase